MAFNDGFYWYKNVLKKQLKLALRIYLSIAIFLSPIFLMNAANASAAESWTIEKVVYDNVGKNLSYTASRTNAIASNDYVYKAKVGVTAARTGSTVANMIRMGLAGAALYGILEGVGWIIDNGVVKKLDPNSDSDPYNNSQYLWKSNSAFSADNRCRGSGLPSFANVSDAIAHEDFCTLKAFPDRTSFSCVINTITSYKCTSTRPSSPFVSNISRSNNPNYDPLKEPKYIPVPETEIGDEVNKHPSVIPDIYNPNNPAGGQAPQASNDALNNANPEPRTNPTTDIKKKPNKDTDGDGKPDVYDPELPDLGSEFQLPEFCSWAATVCEWYVRYKEDSDLAKEHRQSEKDIWLKEDVAREEQKTARQEEKEQRKDEKTFWQKVQDWFDWTKDDSDLPEKEQPDDIPDLVISADEVNLSGSSSCPQDSVSFSVMGKSVTLDMPYQPVCDALNFFKPAVLLVGAVASVYIVAGVRTKEEDQP